MLFRLSRGASTTRFRARFALPFDPGARLVRPTWVALAALTVAVAALVGVASPRADGDPASDILYGVYSGRVFFPYGTNISTGAQQALTTTANRAGRAGYPIRVALIGQPPTSARSRACGASQSGTRASSTSSSAMSTRGRSW